MHLQWVNLAAQLYGHYHNDCIGKGLFHHVPIYGWGAPRRELMSCSGDVAQFRLCVVCTVCGGWL